MAAALLALAPLLPSPASAAPVYTYWSLWFETAGEWVYAQAGAGTTPAVDGSVVGWRFTRSDAADSRPALSPDFDGICAGVPTQPGQARVGLVVDFGLESDYAAVDSLPAPSEECVVVAAGSTMATVLLASHTVRDDNGFVCAIDSLPATGCAEEVAAPAIAAPASESELPTAPAGANQPNTGSNTGSNAGWPWLAAGVIAAAAAVAVLRRGMGRA